MLVVLAISIGNSFIYPGDNSGGVVDTMHAGGSALTVSLNDLVDITAQADTASVDLEVFVGSAEDKLWHQVIQVLVQS